MKELRFGVVCYGGVSLAIYMHGITSELQKLVRASKAYCDARETAGAHGSEPANPFRESTTERVYFEIFRQIGAKHPLRVIVDVIAGTSAGGINGVALAKALAHDLDQTPLKQVWFEKASIWRLLSPWRLVRGQAVLNGDRMLRWVHEALSAMNGTAGVGGASLMPEDHQLDLYVTLTDCTGYRRTIDIHDPASIFDREHRHVINFRYNRSQGIDDFGPRSDPGLTLAIRCTSSFPVAFAPVSLEDLRAAARSWADADREAFVSAAFAQYILENADVASSYFIDGGVLNNRPFDHAVRAILQRPAKHEVDRRLIFIEPHPEPLQDLTAGEAKVQSPAKRPRLARVAWAALSSIPSHQPIADALLELARYNQRVLEIKHLIQVLRPKVDQLIQTVTKRDVHAMGVPGWEQLEAWRVQVSAQVEIEAGAALSSYNALKINAVLAHFAATICEMLNYPAGSRPAILVARAVPIWAERAGIITGQPDLTQRQREFLRLFDLGHRRRRLRFLIDYVNQLYPPSSIAGPLPPRDQVDLVKAGIYALIGELYRMGSGGSLASHFKGRLEAVFGRSVIGDADGNAAAARAFVDAHMATLDSIIADVERELEQFLAGFNHRQAQALAGFATLDWASSIYGDLLARYLGFAHWDLLLYPIQALSDVAELDTIEVTRISSEDTGAFEPRGTSKRLKGIHLGNFKAFLDREYRENDFLWGRLDGVERLVGILDDAARENGGAVIDSRLMWQAFDAVLDEEAPNLTQQASRELLDRLRAQVREHLAGPREGGPAPLAEAAE